MQLLRPIETTIKELSWITSRHFARFHCPAAIEFYDNLAASAYQPAYLVNVLPKRKLIYVVVPKAASTRIRNTLARYEGRFSRSLKPSRRSRYRGPYGPRSMTVGSFFNLATSPDTLRFSFVRNPYARLVSCWANKYAGRPLVPGDRLIDAYLTKRKEIDPKLPAGADCTLSFGEFVVFAAAVASARLDIHLQTQADILTMPGIELNLIGKVETFGADFAPVLDHLHASAELRQGAHSEVNKSQHDEWPVYYTSDLADRIYRAYERDFDRFGYTRAITPLGSS